MSPSTARLDLTLVRRGLVRSRTQARVLIDAGLVQVNGQVVTRASTVLNASDALGVEADPYVSRAAHKLLGALEDLDLDVSGRALDAGASTGGFTQVLLERGCAPVYAVDVGHDQLAPQLRDDSRVVVHEGTNLRDLTLDHLDGDPVDLVVADVSFISLTLLLGPLTAVTAPDGRLLVMVKPQFEVGRERLGKNGVVRSPTLHRASLDQVLEVASGLGWSLRDAAPSRVPGPSGNVEYFLLLTANQPVGVDLAHEGSAQKGSAQQSSANDGPGGVDLDAVVAAGALLVPAGA